jgi:2-polyprenyl-6-methoxyphenol hydroxylase-like FAD-dependent oxidoreductase
MSAPNRNQQQELYMQTDVLIVGAGPTGLMLANQLARRGLKPLIIDRHAGPAEQTRAMAVHARTLEIYAKMGLADEALNLGAQGTGANMWSNGQWSARIPLGDIGKGLSPFPFVLMLGQDDNERILGANLTRLGLAVQWRTELISIDQKTDCVDVVLRQPDGTRREVRATWVAGCDGSRSSVRELCGIGFPGEPYEHTFFVADTEAVGPMKPGELNVYLWRDGFHLFFPMRGRDRWRVIGILPERFRDRDDVTFESLAPSIRQEAGAALDFKSCSWFSTYRIHHRAAERFRDRRCFLLGDAAHVHSPMGGQGMNTGLQDAYNLAWKLALVVQGRAASALLDTYEEERIPVAQTLLETTDRAFQLVVADNWFARLLRTRVLAKIAARAMTFERARKRAFMTLSQIGISYPKSTLSQSAGGWLKGAPQAGDRFPWVKLKLNASGSPADIYRTLDDRRFNLLVFGSTDQVPVTSGTFGQLVTAWVIPDNAENRKEMERAQIPASSFFLLRPDGHIGLCGTAADMATIPGYLSDCMRVMGKSQPIIGLQARRAMAM